MKIPLGFKFFPSDQELIHYLLQKSTARPLPCDNVIKNYDLYGKKEPSKVFDGAETSIHYTFTTLKKKTKKGTRFDRTAGTGTWKGVDASKPIHDGNRRLIGFKKNFVYLTKSKTKGGWNMVEYNLDGIALQHAIKLGMVEDYVICCVTKNIKNNQTRKESGQAMLPAPQELKDGLLISQEMKEGPPISQENNRMIIGSTSRTHQAEEHAHIGTESTMAQLPPSTTPPLSNAPQPSMDMMMGLGSSFDLDIDMFLANALEPSSDMLMGLGSAFNNEDIDSFLADCFW